MQILTGTITALPTTATAKVRVQRQWMHPMYKKTVRRDKNYACHIDQIKVKVGDKVEIMPCAPVSKTKRYIIVKVIAGVKKQL